jgi:hypothetical protein
MRATFQGEDEDCPTCQDTRIFRITQQPWTDRNNGDDVPTRLRRGSLSQRYVPTPPPIYTARFEFGSGYGYAEDEGRREVDPDPSPREMHRRIADWADRLPAPQVAGSANTRREMQLYRPREPERFRRVEGSASHHSGVESHTSRSSRRRSDIYDLRSERYPHPRTEDSNQSSYYLRASDEERRGSLLARRHGYPPSLPSWPEHTIAMHFQKQGYLSMQLELKSPGLVHGDCNISIKSSPMRQKMSGIQKREQIMIHLYAEDETATEEVEIWHISEVHSHHYHHHNVESCKWRT